MFNMSKKYTEVYFVQALIYFKVYFNYHKYDVVLILQVHYFTSGEF